MINGNAVGFFEVVFAVWQIINNGFIAVLALAIGWNVFHWPWSVERVHGNEVGKNSGLELFEVFLHAGRFVLENTNGIAALKQCIGSFVGDVKRVGIEFDAAVFPNQAHGIFD